MSIAVEPATATVAHDTSATLTASVVFDMLSNTRRRYVLYHLREHGNSNVRELSRRIAAWENDVPVAEVTSKQRKRVYTALHQTHLPRLDEYDIVEYDCDRGTVQANERIGVFDQYLERPEREQPRWPRYYIGIGLAAITLAMGIIGGVPVLSAVEPGLAALIVGTAIFLVATVHASEYTSRYAQPSLPDLRPGRLGEEAPADD